MQRKLFIRNMQQGERLPAMANGEFGFEHLPLEAEWCWIAEIDQQPSAVLIGGQAHGLFLLFRLIVVAPSSSIPSLPLLLLRRAFRDAKERGCLGFLTVLDDAKPAEVKLMRLILRQGGSLIPHNGAYGAGRL